MAPRKKYSKEEILDAALNIARERGLSAVTSRELGNALGTSTRPIFTAFANMQDLYQNIERAAKDIYNKYVNTGLGHEYPFMGFGLQFFQFAMDEPQLYRLLFMTNKGEQNDSIQKFIMSDDNHQIIMNAMKQSYQIGDEDALWLYENSFIYAYGIVSLCIHGVIRVRQEELFDRYNDMFHRWITGRGAKETKPET